ncbi:MAG: hypothetical protein WC809_18715 [Sinimarinibacterium sp.]|jgi:hypothetical protein
MSILKNFRRKILYAAQSQTCVVLTAVEAQEVFDAVMAAAADVTPAPRDPVADIAGERIRQIVVEGWSAAHDDAHDAGELATAAVCYALNAACNLHPYHGTGYDPIASPFVRWPWAAAWWKPADPRRDMTKAGALLVAEMERFDRKHTIVRGQAV